MTDDMPRLVRTPIPLAEVIATAQRRFGDMAKAAVDVSRGVMAIGGELHSDEEALPLEDGSVQADVWGINIYPARGRRCVDRIRLHDQRPAFSEQSNPRSKRSRNAGAHSAGGRLADYAVTTLGAAHPMLAAGRWNTLPLMEQLGNVGSEVERALRAHEQGRGDRFESALARALELFDLTANDPRWRGHRRREVLRAREQFCRVFFDVTVEAGLADYLRNYFLQFAVAARAKRDPIAERT